MIHNQRNNKQNDKIEAADEKSPQKFPVTLTLTGEKAGKKGHNNVDGNNTDRYHLLRKPEAVQHQCQKQEQAGGEKVGQKQAFENKGKACA